MRNLSKNTIKRFISAKCNTKTTFLPQEAREQIMRTYFHYGRKIEKCKGYEKCGSFGNVGKRFGSYALLTINKNDVPKAARKLLNFYTDYEKENDI